MIRMLLYSFLILMFLGLVLFTALVGPEQGKIAAQKFFNFINWKPPKASDGLLTDTEENIKKFTEAFFEPLLRAILDRDRILDFAGQRENGADRHLRDLTDPTHQFLIVRSRQGDGDHPVEHVQSDGVDFLGHLHRDFLDGFIRDEGGKQIDVGHVHGVGPEATRVVLGEVLFVDDRLHQLHRPIVPFRQDRDFVDEIKTRQLPQAIEELATFWLLHGRPLR